MTVRGLCLILFLLSVFYGDAFAAEEFDRVLLSRGRLHFFDPDARAAALCGTYTAIAEGPATVAWNPAGLGFLQHKNSVSYNRRDLSSLTEIQLNFLSGQGMLKGIGFGGHYAWFDDKRDLSEWDPPEREMFRLTDHFILLGAGIVLTDHLALLPSDFDLAVGVAASHYKESIFSVTEEVSDCDFGVLLKYSHLNEPRLSGDPFSFSANFGYVIRNALQKKLYYNESSYYELGRWDRAGAAVTLGFFDDDRFGDLLVLTLSLERQGLFLRTADKARPMDCSGIELTLADILSIRRGNRNDQNFSNGRRDNWGLGLGLQPGNPYISRFGFVFDYARLELPGFEDIDQFGFEFWVALLEI